MKREKYHKVLFLTSALWNWAAPLLFFLTERVRPRMLLHFVRALPETFLWFNLFFGIVFILGIGYFWASQDVLANRNIIKLGLMGKLWVFAGVAYGWIGGVVTVFTVWAGLIDLIFAALFADVLIRTKKNPRPL